MADSLLDNYNPLYDIHLRQYFALPHMQKHLQKMGLLESTLNLNGDEVYARHHAMMDMMLKNREAQLMKMAELRKKLDAAEKVEICRRIRSGQSPESYRRGKPSRSLSRSRGAQKGGKRQRRFSNSFEDKDFVQNIETQNAEPTEYDVKDPYKRLSANAKRFNYLHRLDDPTLIAYKDNLKRQLQRLERFREISFGPHSVARQPPPPQTSWFFRRRSLPSLTASAPESSLKEPLRSILSMRGRKSNQATAKTNVNNDSRTSCPPTTRKRRDSNSRLPPITGNKGRNTRPTPPSSSAKLPPAGKRDIPSRGRPAAKRLTTSTTEKSVQKTEAKQKNTLPALKGSTALGGAVAAAATSVAVGVANQHLNVQTEHEDIQHSPTPPSSPVLETQPTIDRESPVNSEMSAERHYDGHDNEAFESDKYDDHVQHQSGEILDNSEYAPSIDDPAEQHVEQGVLQSVERPLSVSDESEPEYAEEDQEVEEPSVLEEQDHHVYENEEVEQRRDIPEFKFDQYDSREDKEEDAIVESQFQEQHDVDNFEHNAQNIHESLNQIDDAADVSSSRSSSPVSGPPTPEERHHEVNMIENSAIVDTSVHHSDEVPADEMKISQNVLTQSIYQESEDSNDNGVPEAEDFEKYQVQEEVEEREVSRVVSSENNPGNFIENSVAFEKEETIDEDTLAHKTESNQNLEDKEKLDLVESEEDNALSHQEVPSPCEPCEPDGITSNVPHIEDYHDDSFNTVDHQITESEQIEHFDKVDHGELSHNRESYGDVHKAEHEQTERMETFERIENTCETDLTRQMDSPVSVKTEQDQELAQRIESFGSDTFGEVENINFNKQVESPIGNEDEIMHDYTKRSDSLESGQSEAIAPTDFTQNMEKEMSETSESDIENSQRRTSFEYHQSEEVVPAESIPVMEHSDRESEAEDGISSSKSVQNEGIDQTEVIDSHQIEETYTTHSVEDSQKVLEENSDNEDSHLIKDAITEAPVIIGMVESFNDQYVSNEVDNSVPLERSIDDYELKYDEPKETIQGGMTSSIHKSSEDIPESDEIREWDDGNKHIIQNITEREYTDNDGVTHYTKSETITVEQNDVSENMEENGSIKHEHFDNNGSTDSLVIHDEPTDYHVSMTQSVYQHPDEQTIETVERKEWQDGNEHVTEEVTEFTDESGRHFTETITTTSITSVRDRDGHEDDFTNNNDDGDETSTDGEDKGHGTNGNIPESAIRTEFGVATSGIIFDDGDEDNISSI